MSFLTWNKLIFLFTLSFIIVASIGWQQPYTSSMSWSQQRTTSENNTITFLDIDGIEDTIISRVHSSNSYKDQAS